MVPYTGEPGYSLQLFKAGDW